MQAENKCFCFIYRKKYRGRFYNYVAPLAPNTQLLRPYKASQKLGVGYEVYGVGRKPVHGEIKVNKIDSSCKLKKNICVSFTMVWQKLSKINSNLKNMYQKFFKYCKNV